MRQRAMIAMALACDPAIVIGDEPTTALDVMVQAQILQLLEDLRAKLGLSLDAHHPRPVGHRRDLRPGPDHVRRPRRGGGPGRRGLPPAAPPVHPEAPRGVPQHRAPIGASLEVIPGSPPDLRNPPPGCRFAPRCFAAMAICTEVVPPGADVRRRPGRLPPVPRGRRRPAGHRGARRCDRADRRWGSADGRAAARAARAWRSTSRSAAGSSMRCAGRSGWRRPRRRRDRPDPAPRRGPRAGRRVGQRQDDHRPGHRQAHPPDRRPDPVRGRGRQRHCGATRALRDYRRRVQLIFQDPYETLNPKQTIYDFVAEPLVVNGIGDGAGARGQGRRGARSRPACARRPISRPRFPHELSGGQRQRVVIAGALVMDPEVIVADEPVSMLDVSIRTELLRLMLDLRRERGLTYLFITHDLSLAWVIADRIAVMYLGKIMEIGPAEAVIRSPRNPYTQALVSVSPSPDPPTPGNARQRARSSRARRRTPRTSRPAAGSTRAARWRSTAARSRSRRCSTSAVARPPPAGWPSRTSCRSSSRARPIGRRDGPSCSDRRDRRRPRSTPASRSTRRAVADLLAATAATVVAELTALGDARGWRPEPGRVERQRMRRPPHRGRAARVRRSDPARSSAAAGRTSRPTSRLGSTGRRRGAPRPPARPARSSPPSSTRSGPTASPSSAASAPSDLDRIGHASRRRPAARRRTPRRVGPPRPEPRPPDAGGDPGAGLGPDGQRPAVQPRGPLAAPSARLLRRCRGPRCLVRHPTPR